MATPSVKLWLRRRSFGLYELLLEWWRHRVSFLLSLGITLLACGLYYFTFLGEKPTPVFEFLQRLEYDTIDTRFRYPPRSATPADPRIVIVDIDQHSQEVLGRWPVSRTQFAKLLDVLAGARGGTPQPVWRRRSDQSHPELWARNTELVAPRHGSQHALVHRRPRRQRILDGIFQRIFRSGWCGPPRCHGVAVRPLEKLQGMGPLRLA